MSDHDTIQRFLFQDFNVRGEIVQLERTYREIVSQSDYPLEVRILLGELLAATALLSATVKFQGSLTVQANTNGRVRLLMAECRNQTDLRAIARMADKQEGDWFGSGQMAITIEPDNGDRYQGIVSLEHDTLSHALELYFQQSEQLNTRLWLSANEKRAGGLMLQCLPKSNDRKDLMVSDEDWHRTTLLASTVDRDELLDLPPPTLLTRLFHEEHVRIYDPRVLRFRCNCSRERSANAIKFLGFDEALELIETEGGVEIDCQFCHARYRFKENEVRGVFASEAAPEGTTLH